MFPVDAGLGEQGAFVGRPVSGCPRSFIAVARECEHVSQKIFWPLVVIRPEAMVNLEDASRFELVGRSA